MSDLAEQIDALLALNASGKVSHPVPGLAVELLTKAAEALRAAPVPVPVAYQWRLKERVMAHDATWSYVDYHTGLKIAEHPEKYETRPVFYYAAPAPVPVTITDEMVERGCDSLFPNWRDRASWTQERMKKEVKDALTAALSAKPGEQG